MKQCSFLALVCGAKATRRWNNCWSWWRKTWIDFAKRWEHLSLWELILLNFSLFSFLGCTSSVVHCLLLKQEKRRRGWCIGTRPSMQLPQSAKTIRKLFWSTVDQRQVKCLLWWRTYKKIILEDWTFGCTWSVDCGWTWQKGWMLASGGGKTALEIRTIIENISNSFLMWVEVRWSVGGLSLKCQCWYILQEEVLAYFRISNSGQIEVSCLI